MLDEIKDNVLKNNIELKEDKKKQTIDTINALNRGFLMKFADKYNEMVKRKKGIENSIEKTDIIKKINELDDQIGNSESNIKLLSEDVKKLTDFYEKIDVETLKNNLQEDIRDMFKISVSIY